MAIRQGLVLFFATYTWLRPRTPTAERDALVARKQKNQKRAHKTRQIQNTRDKV